MCTRKDKSFSFWKYMGCFKACFPFHRDLYICISIDSHRSIVFEKSLLLLIPCFLVIPPILIIKINSHLIKLRIDEDTKIGQTETLDMLLKTKYFKRLPHFQVTKQTGCPAQSTLWNPQEAWLWSSRSINTFKEQKNLQEAPKWN